MSNIQNMLTKANNTGAILEQILRSLSDPSAKTIDYYLQCKSTIPSSENDTIPRLLKQVDILLSEIIYEILDYLKMSQSISSFTSECNISSKKIRKFEILNKLGIKIKSDNQQIFSSLRIPLLYYIIFYFMTAIKEDYEKVLNVFENRQNDVIARCEELVNSNIIFKNDSIFNNIKNNNYNNYNNDNKNYNKNKNYYNNKNYN